MKKTNTVTIDEKNPDSVQLIADAILKVSEAFEQLENSRLTRRAIVLLLQDSIGVARISRTEIESVLDYAPKLKDLYLKKKI